MILKIFTVLSVLSITYGQKPIVGHPPPAPAAPTPAVHAAPQSPGMQQSPSPIQHPEPVANPAPSTATKNESHPCTNANISECFHLIAVQMNKTEELLKMANQTLNTAAVKPAIPAPAAPVTTGNIVPVATNTGGNTGPVSARVAEKSREKREIHNP